MAFLESQPFPLPTRLTPGASDASGGEVRAGFDRASVLLRNSDGKFVRLDWESGGGAEKSIHLPPGTYQLRGYRILKKAKDGTDWFISGIPPKPVDVRVEAGKRASLLSEDTITVASRNVGGNLGMEIRGLHHSGVSIYRNGKRIPISYELLDAAGKVVESGRMTYG
ncbi:MAG: hypothetical protein HND42_10520 [Armatimonadetes bacterium]|nr:hypothetical protein [Armatimonadota bacterium]NOG93660.1 hypothetical protein [Armatimonadota bacterium]